MSAQQASKQKKYVKHFSERCIWKIEIRGGPLKAHYTVIRSVNVFKRSERAVLSEAEGLRWRNILQQHSEV